MPPVERVSVEADEAVDSASPSPTSLLQNPSGLRPSGFAQLPQDAVQQHPGTGGEISQDGVYVNELPPMEPGTYVFTKDSLIRLSPGPHDGTILGVVPIHDGPAIKSVYGGVTLTIPENVFEGFPSDLWTFIRKEVYQMTRAAGLCWQCRRPTGGPTLCEEHRVKASKNQIKSARRKKREAREKKLRKKLGTADNVVDALSLYVETKARKR